MDQLVLKAGGEVMVHAYDASEQLEQRNVGGARSALIKAGAGVVKHMKEIMELLKRYAAVEQYYKLKEKTLIGKINDILAQEQRAQSNKLKAEAELQVYKSDLSRHEADLRSARRSYEEADKKRKENNAGTAATGVVAGVAVLATIFTLGAAAPVALPVAAGVTAAGATAGAIAFDCAADKAKEDMQRSESRIRDTRSKISSTESSISSIGCTIEELNREQQKYEYERKCLQEEKGKLKKVIMFLMDAQVYGRDYTTVMEDCSVQTALTKRMVDRAETQYSLFDSKGTERIVTSFGEAWAAFEEMNKNGSNYAFEIEFDCSQCSSSCMEFPQVSDEKLICHSCYSELY